MDTPGTRLRQALKQEQPLQVIGAICAYHARLAQRAGYRAIYLSGGGVAAGSLGMPDLGISNLDDVLIDIRRITDVCDLPLLVDADTGFGASAFNVARTTRSILKAGAAAMHIEDQVGAKRCGHRPGKEIVSKEEMCDRIKAAVDARTDGQFVARCSDGDQWPTPGRVRELMTDWGGRYPVFGPEAALELLLALAKERGLPAQIQHYIVFVGAVSSASKAPDAARELLRRILVECRAEVMVAASVHAGAYQAGVADWLRLHRAALQTIPAAFVSVCLGVLQKDPKVQAGLRCGQEQHGVGEGRQHCRAPEAVGAEGRGGAPRQRGDRSASSGPCWR